MLADRVRQELRRLDPTDSRAWLDVCDRALAEALDRGSPDDAAEIVLLAAVRLDVHGRFDEAVAQIDFALGLTGGAPATYVHLTCARGALLALRGDVEGARDAIERAADLLDASQPRRAHLEFEVYHVLVACLALDEIDVDASAATIGRAMREGYNWLASGLVVWLVPWLVSRGMRGGVPPWVKWLRLQSDAVAHPARFADAAAFAGALEAVASGYAVPLLSPESVEASRNAAWRGLLVRTRSAFVRGDWRESERLLADLRARTATMNPGFAQGIEGFRALLDVYRGLELRRRLLPPDTATLVTLPAWLAAAEATAIGGSRAEAARWSALVEQALPPTVVSCLEWPVSVARVRALLAVNAGDPTSARRLFRAAIETSEAAGDRVEASLARLQYAQVLAPQAPSGKPPWAPMQHAGRLALHRFGIDPAPHAYAAARAWTPSARDGGRQITEREVEVLRLLEAGYTYRQVAVHLQVSWRTVQSHATHIYRKLGVEGKAAAIVAARAQRLL